MVVVGGWVVVVVGEAVVVVDGGWVVVVPPPDLERGCGSCRGRLREGLEAALIVGILLAYVGRREGSRESHWIWAGTASAAVLSAAAGIVIFNTIGSLTSGPRRPPKVWLP